MHGGSLSTGKSHARNPNPDDHRGSRGVWVCGLRGQKAGTVAGPHDPSHRGERERQGTGDDEEEKTAVQQEKELEDEKQNGLKFFTSVDCEV